MSEHEKTLEAPRRPRHPALVARSLYGSAFEAASRDEIADAMAEWAELEGTERSFALGHLLYLNLQTQTLGLRLLQEIRDILEDTDDAVQILADAVDRDTVVTDEDPGGDDVLEGSTEEHRGTGPSSELAASWPRAAAYPERSDASPHAPAGLDNDTRPTQEASHEVP